MLSAKADRSVSAAVTDSLGEYEQDRTQASEVKQE